MFTGIVETAGEVVSIVHREGGARLVVRVGKMAGELTTGESVAVNGCCLTVTEFDAAAQTAAFDLLIETLRVTNLGDQREGSVVNLERSLRVGDRLSGHFVQGHVDATAKILALEAVGMDHLFAVELPAEWAHLVVHKGSLCVNGISLTVADVGEDQAEFWIIPHTYAETNLKTLKVGDRVNLEFDMLAKHVAVMMERFGKP
jgi:riboflavin synthase